MRKTLIILFFFIILLSACAPKYSVELGKGNDIIGLNDTYVDEGCFVKSNQGNSYTMDVVSNDLDTSSIGEYTITYEFSLEDTLYTCKRRVIVIDDLAPSASLNPGIDTVKVNTEHIDAGIEASDETSDITISVENNVDTSTPGTYEINYTVADEAGNTTFLTRIVTVTE